MKFKKIRGGLYGHGRTGMDGLCGHIESTESSWVVSVAVTDFTEEVVGETGISGEMCVVNTHRTAVVTT